MSTMPSRILEPTPPPRLGKRRADISVPPSAIERAHPGHQVDQEDVISPAETNGCDVGSTTGHGKEQVHFHSANVHRIDTARAIGPSGPPGSDEDDVYALSESECSDCSHDEPPIIHVEVRLRSESAIMPALIKVNVASLLQHSYEMLSPYTLIPPQMWEEVGVLGQHVERIYIAECGDDSAPVALARADLKVHVYRGEMGIENIIGGLEEDEEESRTSAATVRDLPAIDLESSWENLIMEGNLKPNLLQYISSASRFAENEIDFNVVSWNRLILLYGPPGTGKTSLCRALAHKLAVRGSDRYTASRLVEINSHSLFSKWFSESGKLVQKLFDEVNSMADDDSCFVVVMIDEVESLTAARAGAMSGSEPSDALRVVNALLTQLDRLRTRRNVLVMTTSNLAGSIDPAFVDRADIKQYVGPPPAQAIYWILRSCLQELGEKGLAAGARGLLSWAELARFSAASAVQGVPPATARAHRALAASKALQDIAERCYRLGISGRFLRRVPLMAHARYLVHLTHDRPRVGKWVDAIGRAVDDEDLARTILNAADGKREPNRSQAPGHS